MTENARKILEQAAAVGILALLVWALLIAAVFPVLHAISDEREWRMTTVDRVKTLQSMIDRRHLIVAELAALRRHQDSASLLWKRSSDVALAASVEGLVRSFVPTGGQVTSVSSNAPFADHGLRHISVRFDAAIELSAMTHVLASIENARPKVFIDRLSVTAPLSVDLTQPSRVTMECDLSAFAEGSSGP